ncbi:MAG: hypothetical protein PHE89_08235 [Alphaproteobacteria bacterium]|nr:hypothetical protein [Alphaproteobacteria bacterium]
MSKSEEELYEEAVQIASSRSVETAENSVVLFSISYLPTEENKQKAYAFLKDNPEKTIIDNTPCGQALMTLSLHAKLPLEKVCEIWKICSKRFIEQAKGEVIAFVEGADSRSVFYSIELPELLRNKHLTTINGVDKFEFYDSFVKANK